MHTCRIPANDAKFSKSGTTAAPAANSQVQQLLGRETFKSQHRKMACMFTCFSVSAMILAWRQWDSGKCAEMSMRSYCAKHVQSGSTLRQRCEFKYPNATLELVDP